ncbi:MAG: L-2-amino-thiazoline-4-carboxylic acid hydrolase [Gaiellaceae bacterium]
MTVDVPGSENEQAKSCAARWEKLLDWLDNWFQPEKVDAHDFDAGERELFESLASAWLGAAPGAGKIAVFESVSDKLGRKRVLDLIAKICADETGGYWRGLAREGGGTLDDLVRLLWNPLPELNFEFSSESRPDGLQFCVTRCPHAELAAELGAADWLYALVCAGDPHIAAAFDPPIRFRRTKTLMQGDDCCDHAYFVD